MREREGIATPSFIFIATAKTEVVGKEKVRLGVAQDRTRVQMLTSEKWLKVELGEGWRFRRIRWRARG